MQMIFYWHFPAYLEMYKKDRAFEDSAGKPWYRTTPVSVIRDGDWKLLFYFENEKVELFNLASDIGEKIDLATKEPLKAKKLLRKLKEWQTEAEAFIPTRLNPEYNSVDINR